MPGDHRELEPPDPIPNSVVKWFIADGSVGFPHVRVGHRQASKNKNPSCVSSWGFLFFGCDYVQLLLSGPCENACTEGTAFGRQRRRDAVANDVRNSL